MSDSKVYGIEVLTEEQRLTLKHIRFNPDTNQVETDRSFESILTSFKLGQSISISAMGEQIGFQFASTGLISYPMIASIKDQSIVANQGPSGIIPPSMRTPGDNLIFIEPAGPVDTSGIVDYVVNAVTTLDAFVFSIEIIVEEAIGPTEWIALENFFGVDERGIGVVLQHVTGITLNPGDTLKIDFDPPIARGTNRAIFARFVKKDSQDGVPVILKARRSLTQPTRPWFKVGLRTFVDTRIADRGYVNTALLGQDVADRFTDEVAFHSDLPPASGESGNVFRVLNQTTDYWILPDGSRFLAGFYESDGTNWIIQPNAALPAFDIPRGDTALTTNYRIFTPTDMKYIHDDGHHGLNKDPDSFGHGVNSLISTTTGSGNTVAGTNSGMSIQGGFFNAGFGLNSITSLTNGFFNVAVGPFTLSIATDQFDNTALGYNALKFSIGSGSTAVGSRALSGGILTGPDNTGLGVDTLNKTTSGSRNVAIAPNALFNNTVGKSKIAIGHSAFISNVIGDFGIAIGDKALFLSIGDGNVGIGFEVGSSITTAIDFVGIGTDVYRLGTASGNTIMGARAVGGGSPTGIDNSIFGRDSLFNATTATDNSTLGRDTLFNALSAKSNVALGPAVMFNNIGGDFNFGAGHQALLALTESNDTIGIGFAVLSNLTIGDFNIAFGCDAGSSVIAGSRNIFLGPFTSFATDVSDSLNIGNALYANMAVAGAAKFGINSSSPSGSLEVVGPQAGVVGGFAAGELQIRSTSTSPFAGAVITGHNSSVSGNTQVWYFGSVSSSNDDIALINRRTNGSLQFWTANTERLRVNKFGDGVLSGKFLVGQPASTLPFAPFEVVGAVPANRGGFPSGTMQIRNSGALANDMASISGHNSFNTNTQLWFLGSPSTGDQDVAFINRQTSASLTLGVNVALNDGTRDRLVIDGTFTTLVSPDGLNTVILDNFGVRHAVGAQDRISADATTTSLISPNNLESLTVDDTGAFFNTRLLLTVSSGVSQPISRSSIDNGVARFDGTDGSRIQSSGVKITDDDILEFDNSRFITLSILTGQNEDNMVGPLTADLSIVVPTDVTRFTVRDLNNNIGIFSVRIIFIDGTDELTLTRGHDYVEVYKINGEWYFYNIRTGISGRVTT